MLTLFLDVETVPGDCPPGPLTEMAARQRDERDQVPDRFASLSPYLCKVACVCIRAVNSTTVKDAGKVVGDRSDEDFAPAAATEADLLRWVNFVVSEVGPGTRLVTFGGRWFDLPVIVSRMIANDIKPAAFLRLAIQESRYRPERHVDLIEVLTNGGASKKPSLREVCLGWGLDDPKDGCDGGDVAGMIQRGEHHKVRDYCMGDVRATAAIYDRLQAAGLC